jgi:hypothetical protein
MDIIIIIIIIIIAAAAAVCCHQPAHPDTPSLEPPAIPSAQASSFSLQYFPHYL